MTEPKQIWTKVETAEALQYDGTNFEEIKNKFTFTWKTVGEVIYIFDDQASQYVTLEKTQWVVSRAKDGDILTHVYDPEVFWEIFVDTRPLTQTEERKLRTEAANVAAHAMSGSGTMPSVQYARKLMEETEHYLKGLKRD